MVDYSTRVEKASQGPSIQSQANPNTSNTLHEEQKGAHYKADFIASGGPKSSTKQEIRFVLRELDTTKNENKMPVGGSFVTAVHSSVEERANSVDSQD